LKREIERRLGARPFDVVMVHASLGGLAPMFQGDVRDIFGILLDLCENRTLAMPAFFFGHPIGHHNASDYYAEHPVFDVSRAVAQTGLLAELFRRHPGTLRSNHPTHSVCAFGPNAARIVAGHHRSSETFGPESPFGVMSELNTVILGLGIPYYRCLTQMHAPEGLMGESFPIDLRMAYQRVDLLDEEGGWFEYTLGTPKHESGRDLGILRSLLTREELMEWRFKGAPMFLTSARRVTEALCQAAEEGRTIYV
jgi:aminoglycoside 3-N-acetyltransferase